MKKSIESLLTRLGTGQPGSYAGFARIRGGSGLVLPADNNACDNGGYCTGSNYNGCSNTGVSCENTSNSKSPACSNTQVCFY